MGKVAFANVRDMSGEIQLFIRRDALPDGAYDAFRKWDIGDIVGATGSVFRTKTGELSIQADSVRLLAKSLRPAAGEVPWSVRPGNPLSPPLPGFDHQ